MARRLVLPFLLLVVQVAGLAGEGACPPVAELCPPVEECISSYLYQPSHCLDCLLREPAEPYLPQPGDIMLATDINWFWTVTHDWGLAFEPHNSAIVFARPDGSLAILEAGPNDTFWVGTLDMLPHLGEYSAKGPVWIRKRCCPLTPEQSCRLTEFALKAEGRRFALGRLGAQLTPFRTRGPLRTCVLGKAHFNRRAYYCSELVTTACVYAGIMDPATTRPGATYPHDLFVEKSLNPFLQRNFEVNCCWEPPARWTCCPDGCDHTPCPRRLIKNGRKAMGG